MSKPTKESRREVALARAAVKVLSQEHLDLTGALVKMPADSLALIAKEALSVSDEFGVEAVLACFSTVGKLNPGLEKELKNLSVNAKNPLVKLTAKNLLK